MGAGGGGLTEKERGENIKGWLICRRVTLRKCHVFSSDFWGWGGAIMCCVVHSGIEGQINRESGVPLCSGPLIGHNDRGDPSLLSLTGWGSAGVEAVGPAPAG